MPQSLNGLLTTSAREGDPDLLFNDWIHYLTKTLETETWVPLYHIGKTPQEDIALYSALIPLPRVKKVLSNPSWEVDGGEEIPIIDQDIKGQLRYLRYGNTQGIEPIVINRHFDGAWESELEVSEEFRLFHNLYYDRQQGKFVKIFQGKEEDAIRISRDDCRARLHLIKEFLSVKKMKLAIFCHHLRWSGKSLSELVLAQDDKLYQSDDYILARTVASDPYYQDRQSLGILCGKRLISGSRDFDPRRIFRDPSGYMSFIIREDEDGNVIEHTCDYNRLSNGFGSNLGAPRYLTPVFFTRDVLQKYYLDEKKYKVEDGMLSCGDQWLMRIDNSQKEYIIAYLGDLGRDLPLHEQHHWKSHNVRPDGTISRVAFQRDFMAIPTEPEKSDLLFKYRLNQFQEMWKSKFGWYLFKPLSEGDAHYLSGLRIPLNDSQTEFDQQVECLSKVMIESLNEDELKKGIEIEDGSKGISKLQKFLAHHDMPGAQDIIAFLRNLHDLRSGVGHRKGKDYERGSKYFALEEKGLIQSFDDILKEACHILKELEDHFLK